MEETSELASEATSVAQLPPELRPLGLKVEECRTAGEMLFETSGLGIVARQMEEQLEGRKEDVAQRVAENQPHLKDEVGNVRQSRRETGEKASKAKAEKLRLKRQQQRLKKGQKDVGQLMAGVEPDIVLTREMFDRGKGEVAQAMADSLAHLERQTETEETRELEAGRAKGSVTKYAETVWTELAKQPSYRRVKGDLDAVEGALTELDQAREVLVLHKAGLVAAAERVVEQARADKPLTALLEQDIKLLDKIQEATYRKERGLSRGVEMKVRRKVLGEGEGNLEQTVAGIQDAKEIEKQRRAEELVDTTRERLHEGFSKFNEEAVAKAAGSVRTLVEEPKRPLSDELLTDRGLQEYRERRAEEIADPIHRRVFEAAMRATGCRSVENELGCVVEVAREEGKPRKITFSTKEEARRGLGIRTPLFEELVDDEEVETEIRHSLSEADPTNIESVQTLTAALAIIHKDKEELIKNINSRINAAGFADSVRGGAFKVRAAETGVKAGETAVAVAVLAGVTTVLTGHHLHEGRDAFLDTISRVGQIRTMTSAEAGRLLAWGAGARGEILGAAAKMPGEMAKLWAELSGTTFEQAKQTLASINLTQLGEAIQTKVAGAISETSRNAMGDTYKLAGQLRDLADKADQITELNRQMGGSGQKAQQIMGLAEREARMLQAEGGAKAAAVEAVGLQEAARHLAMAKLYTLAGTAAGISSGLLTFTELGRRGVAGIMRRPVRAIERGVGGVLGRLRNRG